MGVEIERRFLVNKQLWSKESLECIFLEQAYLSIDPMRTIRVRCSSKKEAFLTIKSTILDGKAYEYEYSIPFADAESMIRLMSLFPPIKKKRYSYSYHGKVWVIDEFLDANAGLLLAEIELSFVDESFFPPPWLGQEVTQKHEYANSSLSQRPFSLWSA